VTEEKPREQQRVPKRDFLSQVAERSHIPVKTVTRVYDTILEELMEIATRGDQLMLTGFGKFYPQAHKGHQVQFAGKEGAEEIPDYHVLKFSATRTVNKALSGKPVERDAVSDGSVDEDAQQTLYSDIEEDEFSEPSATKTGAKRAPTKPRTRAPKATTPTAADAAAAIQSTRSSSRAKRETVGRITKTSNADRAI
jgi:DNA-binding protein HU-beta